jgi:hypothetical protein
MKSEQQSVLAPQHMAVFNKEPIGK